MDATQHLPLVVKILAKHGITTKHKLYDDLLQEGLIGLYKALKTYNHNKGELSTHLYFSVRHNIQYYLAQNSLQMNYGTYLTMLKHQKPETSLQKEYSRGNSPHNRGSFLDFCKTDTKTPFDELCEKEEELVMSGRIQQVMDVVKELPVTEQRIIKILYGKGHYFTERQKRTLNNFIKRKGKYISYEKVRSYLIRQILKKLKKAKT